MWKVFISHTPEDNDFVDELTHELEERHISVIDENSNILNWGDSLVKTLENNFQQSAYGILVLSRDFLSKLWSRRELDGLVSLGNQNALLTIWRNLTKEEVARYSQALADTPAIPAERGVQTIAETIADVVNKPAAPNINSMEQYIKNREYAGAKTLSAAPPDLATLMMHNFSESELRDICFYLDVESSEEPESKGQQINYLISKLKRRGDLERLLTMLSTLKPQIDWASATV